MTQSPLRPGLEISASDACARHRAGSLLIIDCRTPEEFACSRVQNTVLIPLQEIEKRHDEIEPAPGQDVAILCHHGVRSLKATLLLRELGLRNVVSIAGGIEEWSRSADPSVPRYEREGPICRIVK